MGFRVPTNKPQPPAKTKAAAKRKTSASTVTVSSRLANPIVNPGVGARAPQAGAAPQMSLPNGTPAVTPVSPPNIDPYLTPTDEANQTLENATWDQYLSGLDLQTQQAQADSALKIGDIGRSLDQALTATDWNSAARGLQNSSIKDTNKIQMRTQAAATQGAEQSKQTGLDTHTAGEHNRVATQIRPAIEKKYNDLRIRNATAAKEAWNSAHPDSPTGSDGQANPYYRAPEPAAAGAVDAASAPADANTIPSPAAGTFNAPTAAGWTPEIRDGWFGHLYAGGRFVKMRKIASK